MQNSKQSGVVVIAFLGLINSLAPISTDMYVPAIPQLSNYLHDSQQHILLTLSSFFTGLCIGQLIWGPLSDRYGRKPILKIGMLMYLIMTFLCTIPFSGNEMIVVRFFQAIGGSACLVTAMAMVNDLFPIEKRTNIFTQLTIIMGLAPAIAPVIGTFLLETFNWQATFYGQLFLGFIGLFGILFVLPDGHLANKEQSMKLSEVGKRYLRIITDKQFIYYALVCSFAMGAMFAYIGGFNFVIINVQHQSEKTFSILFSSIALSIMIAGILNRKLHDKIHADTITNRTMFCMTIFAIALAICEWFHCPFAVKYTLLLLAVACTGFIRPNAISLALRPFSKESGSAAAVVGALQFLIASFASGWVSSWQKDSALPMVIVLLVCVLISGIFLLKANTKREVL